MDTNKVQNKTTSHPGRKMSQVRSRRSSAYTGSSCSPGLAGDRCLGSCSGFEVKPTLHCSLSLRNHLSFGEEPLDGEGSSIVIPAMTVSQCSVTVFGLCWVSSLQSSVVLLPGGPLTPTSTPQTCFCPSFYSFIYPAAIT